MKKLVTTLSSVALLFVGAITLSGCGGSNSSSSDSIISVYGCEPQQTLVPGNTNETCGGNIINELYDALITYDTDGKVQNEIAESITPSDENKVYDVKIKSGLTFDNGEAITSDSFIKSWNYTAADENAQSNQSFFELIKGYDEVSKENSKVNELSGLQKISDTEFKIELTESSITFPMRLGYSAFYPLPVSAFDANGKLDPNFGEHPIGNGPYKFEAWNHDQDVKLVKSDTYKGDRPSKNAGLDYKIYTGGTEAAYADVQSGALDVLDTVPQTQNKTFQNDPQVQPVIEPSPVYQGLEIPDNLPHFGYDEEGQLRRAAISMAIDRPTIIANIVDGLADVPAGFSPNNPRISGAKAEVKGNDVLKFNSNEAKQKWEQADAISKFDNPHLDIYFNADGGAKSLLEAVANSIKTSLGIESSVKAIPDFKTLLNKEAEHQMDGAFRMGWQPDYPSVENYLQPLYTTNAAKTGSNYSGFANKDFDDLLLKGAAASSIDEANDYFTQAQEFLMKYLPCFPIYDRKQNGVSAIGVKGLTFDWKSMPVYTDITKG
ncbi:MAG: ABC transporter substrate-binding protein [Bifidobacteriaceae bacterium]|nr:ABC transporter substrate-binding protein [Bifidobacteriaceae bacterium]